MDNMPILDQDAVNLQFRSLDCAVKGKSENTFEIVPQGLPLATVVFANPFFVQFTRIFKRSTAPYPTRYRDCTKPKS